MTGRKADAWQFESRNRREAHAEWLGLLPSLVAEVERRWSLRVQEPLESSCNYVARASHVDVGEVVLKLGVPGIEFVRELEALRLYAGRGAVFLLKADPTFGSMMLESARPGRVISDITSDEEATATAASVMRSLWRPAPEQHPFAAMSEFEGGVEWLRICLADESCPIPRMLASRAEGLLRELATAQANQYCYTGICTTTTSCLPSVFLGSRSALRGLGGSIRVSTSPP